MSKPLFFICCFFVFFTTIFPENENLLLYNSPIDQEAFAAYQRYYLIARRSSRMVQLDFLYNVDHEVIIANVVINFNNIIPHLVLHSFFIVHDNRSQTILKVNFSEAYEHIEHMPVEELLHAIDSIIENIQLIHGHYETTGLTATEWLTNYWWIPSLFCSTLLFKVIKYYFLTSK